VADWEVKKLGDVLSIERGGSPRPIKKYLTELSDGINWIKISDATASEKYIYETKEKITRDGLHKTRIVNEGDFILSNSMSFGRPYIMKTTGCIHDGWLVLKQTDKKLFETDFLYYLLSSPYIFQQFDNLAAGSTVRNLNIALVSSVKVPIPSLPEQKHIVAILDEAFESIAKAKYNAENNLKNANEIFESYLQSVFENKGEGWEEKTLGNFLKLEYGKPLDKSKRKSEGKYPVYGANGEKNRTDEFYHDKFSIIIGRKGSAGEINFTERKFWPLDVTYFITFDDNKYSLNFIYYLLSGLNLPSLAKGVKPGINRNEVYSINVQIPSLTEQQSIVTKLDALSAETKKLEAIYEKKLVDLEELKKSILQKAFDEELK